MQSKCQHSPNKTFNFIGIHMYGPLRNMLSRWTSWCYNFALAFEDYGISKFNCLLKYILSTSLVQKRVVRQSKPRANCSSSRTTSFQVVLLNWMFFCGYSLTVN